VGWKAPEEVKQRLPSGVEGGEGLVATLGGGGAGVCICTQTAHFEILWELDYLF